MTAALSVSALSVTTHKTSGSAPPPLVGASMTPVDACNRLYVFSGRLATSRAMTNDLYELNTATLHWRRLATAPAPGHLQPQARYFHSASYHAGRLIVFGGMGYSAYPRDGGETPGKRGQLTVLDDLHVLDLETLTWTQPQISPGLFDPQARYAHNAAVAGDRLIVIGGQDITNAYIEEVNLLDLNEWTWTLSRACPNQLGTYRSVAATVAPSVAANIPLVGVCNRGVFCLPAEEGPAGRRGGGSFEWAADSPPLASPSSTPSRDALRSNSLHASDRLGSRERRTSLASQQHPPPPRWGSLSMVGAEEQAHHPVYIFANYNHNANVRREVLLTQWLHPASFNISTIPNAFQGGPPPYLRFPTGGIVGHHFVIAGTFISRSTQSFSMYALNLNTFSWSRLETGASLAQGSWNSAVLTGNRLLVFGNHHRDLAEDYAHRQLNFEHVAVVDLETYGIYHPPEETISGAAQEIGLEMLRGEWMADLAVKTSDGKPLRVNSRLVAERWPWFRELLEAEGARRKQPTAADPGRLQEEAGPGEGAEAKADTPLVAPGSSPAELETPLPTPRPEDELGGSGAAGSDHEQGFAPPPPYLVDQVLHFPHPHDLVYALMQFLYTGHLFTAEQHQPRILAQLLLLADLYDLSRLKALATHALHQMLNMQTAPLIYESATLAGCRSLLVRALRVMMATKRFLEQQQRKLEAADMGTLSFGNSHSPTSTLVEHSSSEPPLSYAYYKSPLSPPSTSARYMAGTPPPLRSLDPKDSPRSPLPEIPERKKSEPKRPPAIFGAFGMAGGIL
ncbi:uncharacterized protein VTP21DRAFT_7259 [Calcarisporiella thermophila]|uniref:uncharacterized protein n=1 Tax=Calcarisporiella thermophila TaxID=911321 RepID=UPI003741F09F